MEAAGMLLGGIDMLRCKGPVQDIPGDVPGGHLAFVWIFQGLKNVQDTESVFGALRALQTWHWFHRLLFEELEGALNQQETNHARITLNSAYLSIYLCEWKVGNIGATVQLAQNLVATSQHRPRDTALPKRFYYDMLRLRKFESARFAVPIGPTTLPYQVEGTCDLYCCHTATMTGTALGGAVARELMETIRIINPSGLPVFGTLRHVDAAQGKSLIQLWRFTPRASRDAAKPRTDIHQISETSTETGKCTPAIFHAGAHHGERLWLPCFFAPGFALGIRVVACTEGFATMERWSVGEMEDRRGASVVASGDLLITFGGKAWAQAAALYWDMTQPKFVEDGSNSPWHIFKSECASAPKHSEVDLEGGCIIYEPGEAAQMYYTAVNDHVYGAYLVTLEPFTSGTTRDAGQYCKIAGGVWALLGGVLRAMALQGLRLHCAFCSKTELVKPEQQAAVVKVCRGCHLVRYCSLECQAAGWPHHKGVCRSWKQRAAVVQPAETNRRLVDCLCELLHP